MSDPDAIERRLRAVERAVTDDDRVPAEIADAAEATDRIENLESRVKDVEDRLADLEAAVRALRGYVGNVRSVNRDVERRADAAISTARSVQKRLAGDPEPTPETRSGGEESAAEATDAGPAGETSNGSEPGDRSDDDPTGTEGWQWSDPATSDPDSEDDPTRSSDDVVDHDAGGERSADPDDPGRDPTENEPPTPDDANAGSAPRPGRAQEQSRPESVHEGPAPDAAPPDRRGQHPPTTAGESSDGTGEGSTDDAHRGGGTEGSRRPQGADDAGESDPWDDAADAGDSTWREDPPGDGWDDAAWPGATESEATTERSGSDPTWPPDGMDVDRAQPWSVPDAGTPDAGTPDVDVEDDGKGLIQRFRDAVR